MRWTQQNAKRNVGLFYGSSFFGSMDFARGLFVVYLLSQGLTTGQIGILQTALFWSNLLVEIPAGLLADKTKRKYSVVLGMLLIAIAAVSMMAVRSFEAFLVVFTLHGAGFALRSGADGALLFDGLKQAGSAWENRYLKLSSRAKSIGNLAMGAAIAGGGWLASYGWQYVYYAFALAMIVGAALTMLISESAPEQNAARTDAPVAEPGLIAKIKEFCVDARGRSLLGFILAMGFLEAIHAPFFIYVQVIFKDYGISEAWLGLIVAGSMLATSLSYMFAEKLARFSVKNILMVGSCVTSLLAFAFFLKPSLAVAILLFILVDIVPSIVFVHTDNYIHERTPSDIRASVLSMHSLISSIFISIAFLAAGFMMDTHLAANVLGSLGVLPLIGLFALSRHFKKSPTEEAPCMPLTA